MRIVETYPPLGDYLEVVEREIARMSDCRLGALREGAVHVTRGRGKRLRPALLLLAAEACGRVSERVIGYAALMELIHTASLVHDDIVDEAQWRRGMPSARSRWDNKISVLLGDFLLTRCFGELVTLADPELERLVAEVTTNMCVGAVQELISNGLDQTETEYLTIVSAKTACLFGLCAKIGALLAGDNEDYAAALEEYGSRFGLAYQIADDILDLVGDQRETGKPTAADLRQRKITLPLIYALADGCPAGNQELRSILSQPELSEEQLSRVQRITQESGAVEQAWVIVRRYLEQARCAIEPLPESEARVALIRWCEEAFPLPVMA